MMSNHDWLYRPIGGGKEHFEANQHAREYVSPLINSAVIGISAPLIFTNPATTGMGRAAWNLYNTPGVKQVADTYWTYQGLKNLFSENGLKKTYNHFNNGEYWKGTKSLMGDILDAAGPFFLIDDYAKIGKKSAESAVRMGDSAYSGNIFKNWKEQFLNKNTLKYIFDNNADPNLAYNLPFKYSGESAHIRSAPAHYGDVVDQFFGKVDVPVTNIDNLPIEIKNYMLKNYKIKNGKVKYVDLGNKHGRTDVVDPTNYDSQLFPDLNGYDVKNFKDGHREKVYSKTGNNKFDIKSPEVIDDNWKPVLDPGGHNTYIGRSGDDFITENYDIWKFKPKELVTRYNNPVIQNFTGMKRKIMDVLKNIGARWIDSQGAPVIYKWNTPTKGFYKPQVDDDWFSL